MDNKKWFDDFRTTKAYGLLREKPLAYFSIEYALSDKLPTYAGGLGVLAGDFIKELHDQQIPSVAVGLYYQGRYGFDPHASEKVNIRGYTPEEQGLEVVLDNEKKPLIIKVPIHDKEIFVKAWRWEHNSIPVYLLDTDVEENEQTDRAIGHKLYDAEKDVRIKQEMVLGIGGFRLLEALGIKPSLYHMNEGHSALLELEIIRHEMEKQHIGFADAVKMASHHVIFTNHTLVPAGHDIFSNEVMSIILNRYAGELEVPITSITELGAIQDTHDFSLSVFAMRLCGKINGVSKLHAETAKKVWPQYTLEAVTNGIHVPSWESTAAHQDTKKKLLEFIKNETGQDWPEGGLLLGWARRMVRYKRPLALFEDIQKFLSIAKNADRPVHVIMAGVAHEADDEGRKMIGQIQELVKNELQGTVVFLSNYNKTLSSLLVSGCDVWLNTPVVGSEACGTSGMKASLNGVLPLTTKDGWMDEIDINKIGWTIESETIQTSLLEVLENKVVPTFYADKPGWEHLQNNGKALVREQFSATRMLKDYFEIMYLPIINASYEHYSR